MATKLTLALDPDVIERAKEYAKLKNTSLSKLVENFLRKIANTDKGKGSLEEISPLVKKLSGVLNLPPDYDTKTGCRDYISEKYR